MNIIMKYNIKKNSTSGTIFMEYIGWLDNHFSMGDSHIRFDYEQVLWYMRIFLFRMIYV